MRTALWLTARELANRPGALATSVALVATGVAFCATLELLALARDESVARELEAMGPSLLVVREGNGARELAAGLLSGDALREDEIASVRRALAPWLRDLRPRTSRAGRVGGRYTAVIGVERLAGVELAPGDAVLGAELARSLDVGAGGGLEIDGRAVTVASVLPDRAGPDDLVAFVAFEGAPTALEAYLRPEASRDAVLAAMSALRGLSVLATPRGNEAEAGIGTGLLGLRLALYALAAMVAALLLALWSHTNAVDRRVELATLRAIGGTGPLTILLVVLRALAVAGVGSLLGLAAGALIAGAQEALAFSVLLRSPGLALGLAAGALAVASAGAAPAALAALRETPAAVLQS